MIKDKLIETEKKQIEIEKGRKQYQDVAKRGRALYFIMSDLSFIDPMYQFSLSYFSKLFNNIIKTTKKSNNVQIRVN